MSAADFGVVESVDYPNEFKDGRKGNDRIKICEDTNGDGRADKFTVFADGFNLPTSMTFARGGVIVGARARVLFPQGHRRRRPGRRPQGAIHRLGRR